MLKLQIALTLLTLALTTTAAAEKPRTYTANPLDSHAAYSKHARDAYAAGVWTIEEVEIDTNETKIDPEQRQRAYARALQAFAEAVNAEPKMYEAHAYIGYANRKLGNYKEALRAYDTALSIKPDYIYAIEYQGEAYLALGDFSRAKFNYLRLYALDTKLAQQLLEAMQAWLIAPHARDSQEFDAARAWVATQSRS